MSDPHDLCAGALVTAWQDRIPLASLDEWLTPGDLAAAAMTMDDGAGTVSAGTGKDCLGEVTLETTVEERA